MRRRPEEHDREQDPRGRGQRVAHRGPADEHRHRARRAPDHDVLPRRALQPEAVDEDVEEGGGDRQHRAEQVDEGPELGERQ